MAYAFPMRTIPLLVALVLLPALPLPGQDAKPGEFSARVVGISDGDTLTVLRSDRTQVKIRLHGIDAPESVDPRKPVDLFGREASKHLREMIDGKELTIERQPGSKLDKYGRELVYLRLDGSYVGKSMIRDGFAHAYVKYPFDRMEEYRTAEREAREAKSALSLYR